MFPMAIIKISSHLNTEAQLPPHPLSYYAYKILKCILHIYWAILHCNQKSSDFQVSSTSKNECDAAVLWLQSNRGLILSRQSPTVNYQNHWFNSLLLLQWNAFYVFCFLIFQDIFISMIQAPGLRISSFFNISSVQFIYHSLQLFNEN